MKLKTRLLILAGCAAAFLVITPVLVFYALGYRVDFDNREIVSTGGIYVKAVQTGAEISIDARPSERTTYFTPSVFVQNLAPGMHAVSIKKDAYISYQKTLAVEKNEVTKLEDVVLFKEKPAFTLLRENVDYFSVAPDQATLLTAVLTKNTIEFELAGQNNGAPKTYSLAALNGKITGATWSADSKKALLTISTNHFLLDASGTQLSITPLPALKLAKQISFNPQNNAELFYIKDNNLHSMLAAAALIKNVLAYGADGNNLVVFSGDGFLYQATFAGVTNAKMTIETFTVKKNTAYKLSVVGAVVFLQQGENTFSLDAATKTLVPFIGSAHGFTLSPDREKIAFLTSDELFYSIIAEPSAGKISLGTVTAAMSDLWWFNNDYVIFKAGDRVIISEIDARGNVNVAPLPATISLQKTGGTAMEIELEHPSIFFSERDKKVYLLTQRTLAVSEKLAP